MRHCGHKGTEMLSSKTWAVALKQCPVGIKELKNAHTTISPSVRTTDAG